MFMSSPTNFNNEQVPFWWVFLVNTPQRITHFKRDFYYLENILYGNYIYSAILLETVQESPNAKLYFVSIHIWATHT